MEKTNALRILDKAKIPTIIHTYESDGMALDAIEVAQRLHQPIDKVYKTLIVIGASHMYYVLVINGADEIDLKKAAVHLHEKNIEMIPVSELLSVTGYVRGGCSPIGMKKNYVTFFDQKIAHMETVLVSAGRIGQQMEIEVDALIRIVQGHLADLVKAKVS
ncbi:MAG: putative transcription regulator [Erysipelotrichaceae bacterium]|nr:MAG: putative transcription [Erysipelotrichaceae bacterium]TXT17663.1 MAG: putative transcription regulator [Erysipelotrichaceae bacterium]